MNRDNIIALLGLVAACVGVTYGATNTRLVTVEKLVLVNHTITKIVEIPIIVNKTIPAPTAQQLRDFHNRTEFTTWLKEDQTDRLDYSTRFTCMDYTLRCIANAHRDGYRLIFLMEWRSDEETHALCMAYIEDEARYIVFSPQCDRVEWEWSSTRGG